MNFAEYAAWFKKQREIKEQTILSYKRGRWGRIMAGTGMVFLPLLIYLAPFSAALLTGSLADLATMLQLGIQGGGLLLGGTGVLPVKEIADLRAKIATYEPLEKSCENTQNLTPEQQEELEGIAIRNMEEVLKK